ncbi:MAG: hypothetical protein JXR76_13050 [Deltaproteobacteria bacterium]|nr:hypothetical protein [Deltaproteobacteria bacterium]
MKSPFVVLLVDIFTWIAPGLNKIIVFFPVFAMLVQVIAFFLVLRNTIYVWYGSNASLSFSNIRPASVNKSCTVSVPPSANAAIDFCAIGSEIEIQGQGNPNRSNAHVRLQTDADSHVTIKGNLHGQSQCKSR